MLKREWEEEQVVNRSPGFASYFKGFGEECPDETVWKFLAQETCSEGSEKNHYLLNVGEIDVLSECSSRQGPAGMSCVHSQGSFQREIQILLWNTVQ